MAEDFGEKSLDPTPQRRQQARDEGHVAYSADLTSAGMLLGSLAVLMFLGGTLVESLAQLLSSYLSGRPWIELTRTGATLDGASVVSQWSTVLPVLARALLPLLAFMMVLAATLNLLQKGFLFLPRKMMPDWSRVSPWAGARRIFSLSGAVRLGFGMFKILTVAAVAAYSLRGRWNELMSLSGADLPQVAALVWQLSLSICASAAMALLVLAIIDYGYERWKFERDLRMTPQEMREEMRNVQGDPRIVARRRDTQKQLAMNPLSSAVPRADVVIAQPGGVAVALRYDARSMRAPVVVAKGAGARAEHIRGLAAESEIPIVEKSSLAKSLYRQAAVQGPIPEPLYAAVGEALAYAYQVRGERATAEAI